MKSRSKLKFSSFILILAAIPTSAFAILKPAERLDAHAGTPRLNSAQFASVASYSFFERSPAQPLIGLTSQEYKDAQMRDEDIEFKMKERADYLCQEKHFTGAAELPPYEEKTGNVVAVDYDEISAVLVTQRYPQVQGPTYHQQSMNGGWISISKKTAKELRAKGGLYASAVEVRQGPVPVILLHDLQCAYGHSLTGINQVEKERQALLLPPKNSEEDQAKRQSPPMAQVQESFPGVSPPPYESPSSGHSSSSRNPSNETLIREIFKRLDRIESQLNAHRQPQLARVSIQRAKSLPSLDIDTSDGGEIELLPDEDGSQPSLSDFRNQRRSAVSAH